MEIFEKVSAELKANPKQSAAEICRRLGLNVNNYYSAKERAKKLGLVPRAGLQTKTKQTTMPTVQRVVDVPTVTIPNASSRVCVVIGSVEDVSSIIRGLQ